MTFQNRVEKRSHVTIHLNLDWDLTLLNFHTGGIYNSLSAKHFHHTQKIYDILTGYIEGGHAVSITTHGDSAKMIKEGLGVIGLNAEQIAQIPIAAGFKSGDKSQHILEAQKFHDLKEPFRTLLVDDDTTNLTAAYKDGRAVLQAVGVEDGKKSHLDALLKILKTPSAIDRICKAHARKERYGSALKNTMTGRG